MGGRDGAAPADVLLQGVMEMAMAQDSSLL